jgi:hypothetical protein
MALNHGVEAISVSIGFDSGCQHTSDQAAFVIVQAAELLELVQIKQMLRLGRNGAL